MKNWQRGQVLLNSIASGLSAPTQSTTGMVAATASPALSYEIGQQFKKHNAEGTPAHILAHAILGAAVAAAGDNNALAGALSSGGTEAAAPYISKWLYGKEKGSDLTAEEKETVTAITNLLGTATGAVIGGTTANAVQGSLNAQSAVGNNFGNSYLSYKAIQNEQEFAKKDPIGYKKYKQEQLELLDNIAKFIITPYGAYHDYQEAETLTDKALALSSVIPIGKVGNKAKELLQAASQYYQSGKFKEAANAIRQALSHLQSSQMQMATPNGAKVPSATASHNTTSVGGGKLPNSQQVLTDGSHLKRGGKLQANVRYKAGEFDYF